MSAIENGQRSQLLPSLLSLGIAVGASACLGLTGEDPPETGAPTEPAAGAQPAYRRDALHARVVAVGIPGAGAITEIGAFLPGGALHDNPALAAYTQPGRVLAANRLLVASTSNFGAPLARSGEAPGSLLSIDPNGDMVVVPSNFAASGTQASAVGGRVQLYAAQSPAFTHPALTPATYDYTTVSLPTGISLNNGSGRPWFSNAPMGSAGIGTVTITDPPGNPVVVLAGDLTNHTATSRGLRTGALGLALITKSPDASAKPVFATVTADGSVLQAHAINGMDELAPPGTITPIPGVSRQTAESNTPNAVARTGIVFNWAPASNLFITDPLANRLVVVDLTDDGALFRTSQVRQIVAAELNVPIDIAPTTREVAAANFSSNTMLGGGSDLYVLNRGNNTIVRMRLDGKVTDVRDIDAPVSSFRANGIAVSSDNQTLYVSATLPNGQGAVLAVPAFGAGATTDSLIAAARATGATDMTSIGAALFSTDMTLQQGLGPLFNAQSCIGCHDTPLAGGSGITGDTFVNLVGRLNDDGTFDTLVGRGGPAARAHSISELGVDCSLQAGPTPLANVISPRSAMTLRGNGLIDAIRTRDVLANQALQPAAVRGRPNLLPDGRLGKFGWKANVATVVEFMGGAYRNELGITNPLEPKDEVTGCGTTDTSAIEMDGVPLTAVAAFLNTIDPPVPSSTCLSSAGAALFQSTGCASCHTPALPGRGTQVRLYSDLLLHDMGPGLADKMRQGSATGSEWRTMPLWRAVERQQFLHDGRAASVREAITAHGGQAAAAQAAFGALDAASQQALLDFINCI